MKTDELVAVLSRDAKLREPPLAAMFAAALIAGTVASIIYFGLELGVRSNAWDSLGTVRFPLKFIITLLVTVPALAAVYRLMRPEGELGTVSWLMLVAPVALALAVLLELVAVPSDLWSKRLVGQNSVACMISIPTMAIGPLIAAVAVLRYGAVSKPVLASLAAGLASAGIGATLYAAHCPDDSPLFVATWYTIAALIVVTFSVVVVPRLIRW